MRKTTKIPQKFYFLKVLDTFFTAAFVTDKFITDIHGKNLIYYHTVVLFLMQLCSLVQKNLSNVSMALEAIQRECSSKRLCVKKNKKTQPVINIFICCDSISFCESEATNYYSIMFLGLAYCYSKLRDNKPKYSKNSFCICLFSIKMPTCYVDHCQTLSLLMRATLSARKKINKATMCL